MDLYSSAALGGSAAVVVVPDKTGREAQAMAVVSITSTGAEAGQESYALANAVTLAAQGASAPIAGVRRGVYVWDAQWTGAGSLQLQSLGADGVTWRTVATLAAPGVLAGEVRVGANATLRLFNANAGGGASFTALSSTLS